MALIQGKNVVLEWYDNGAWRLYSCARTCTLNVQTSTIETSVTGSGTWKSFEPQVNSFSGTADGLINLDDPGVLTLPDLRQRQIAMIKMRIRFARTDEANNVYTDEGTVIITGSSDTGPYDGVATFSIEFQGTGALVQLFTPTLQIPPIVKRYEYTGVGAETGFTDPLLIGKDIIEANKDGQGNSKLIFTGSPVGKQMLYNTLTGQFTWAIPFEPGEEDYILYQDM